VAGRPTPSPAPARPAPILADSEVLTIECVGEFLGIDTDLDLYQYLRRHWGDWFPALRQVHRTTFVRQAANLWAVKHHLHQHLPAQVAFDPQVCLVDSVAMPICRFARAYRCRRLAGLRTRRSDRRRPGWDAFSCRRWRHRPAGRARCGCRVITTCGGRQRLLGPASGGRRVQVRADLERVWMDCDGQLVADHARCWARHQALSDPPTCALPPGCAPSGPPSPVVWRLRSSCGAWPTTTPPFGLDEGQGVA
jgi:hypothetical protein